MGTKPITFLRRVVLPINSIVLIVLLIWTLQSGRFPGLGGSSPSVVTISNDFFALSGEPLGASRGSGPGLGQPAPEFTLRDVDGQVVRLSDFRGKVVLVNFWATWCPPCRKEFPELVKAYAGGSGDVVVVGVDLQENAGEVGQFARDYGAIFPIVIDARADVAEAYRVLGLPSSYFIDAQGILRDQFFGPLTQKTIADKIAKARAGVGGG